MNLYHITRCLIRGSPGWTTATRVERMPLLRYLPGTLGRTVSSSLGIRLTSFWWWWWWWKLRAAKIQPVPILVSGTVLSSFHWLIILLLRTTLSDGHWYEISLHMSLGFRAAHYDSQDELNSQTLHFNIWKVRIIIMPTSWDEALHTGLEYI